MCDLEIATVGNGEMGEELTELGEMGEEERKVKTSSQRPLLQRKEFWLKIDDCPVPLRGR